MSRAGRWSVGNDRPRIFSDTSDRPRILSDSNPENIARDFVDGMVDFKGAPRPGKSPFIRIRLGEMKESDAYDLLTKVWGLQKPRLLLSVTGGSKNFDLPEDLRKQLYDGVLKVAATPGAWFITGGTNTGVMKYVGQVLQGATNSCIGIATWGTIINREDLIPSGQSDKTQNLERLYPYKVDVSVAGHGAFLDHNHTHFLLVDDGSKREYRKEVNFRMSLESYIMRTEKIPALVLAIEGGMTCIETVLNAVMQTPPVHVVIMKDSGRASDCFVYALTKLTAEDIKRYRKELEDFRNKVKSEIQNDFFEYVQTKLRMQDKDDEINAYEFLLQSVSYKDAMTIYDREDSNVFDEVIFKCLLHSKDDSMDKKERIFHQLKLSILWNRPDMGREILRHHCRSITTEEYKHSMILSLALNRVEFVDIFLEYCVSVHTFLTPSLLDELYGFTSQFMYSPLTLIEYDFLTPSVVDNTKRQASILQKFGVYDLCEVQYQPLNRQTLVEFVDDLCEDVVVENEMLLEKWDDNDDNDNIEIRQPYKELFYWAVLNNMTEMALYLWRFEDEHMMKALIAGTLFERMAEKARRKGIKDDIVNSLTKNSQLFKDQAVSLLKECTKRDELMTEHLIDCRTTHFECPDHIDHSDSWSSRLTCLKVAVFSRHREYVALGPVQQLLNGVWYGALLEINFLQAVLAYIFPPYLIKGLSFKTRKQITEMVNIDDFRIYRRTAIPNPFKIMVKTAEGVGQGGVRLIYSFIPSSGEDVPLVDRSKQSNDYGAKETEATVAFAGPSSANEEPGGSGNEDPGDYTKPDLVLKEKFSHFYRAPVVVFYKTTVWYFLFLLLLSYTALNEKQNRVTAIEYVMFVFMLCKLAEEGRQFFLGDANSWWSKTCLYFDSNWNRLDLAAVTCFFVAFIIRFNNNFTDTAQIFYAIDAGMWILRALYSFYAHPKLGPYIIMIHKMSKDMWYFLAIMLIFMLAYGVSTRAILSPESNVGKMLENIIFKPYFNTYLQLLWTPPNGNSSVTWFGTVKTNDYSEAIVFIFVAAYMLIGNILLINILKAIFNNTFRDVAANSEEVWKYERYNLVIEFTQRSSLLPPFNLLKLVFDFVYWLTKKCYYRCIGRDIPVETTTRLFDHDSLMEFENQCLASLLRKTTTKKSQHHHQASDEIVERSKDTQVSVEGLSHRLKTLEDKLDALLTKLS